MMVMPHMCAVRSVSNPSLSALRLGFLVTTKGPSNRTGLGTHSSFANFDRT